MDHKDKLAYMNLFNWYLTSKKKNSHV